MKTAVIILPTYNESRNIKELLNRIIVVSKKIEDWIIKILVVDSSSPDGTAEIVKEMGKYNKSLHIISTEKSGLGQAYIDGFSYCMENLNPYVMFEMDADLSHNPDDIPAFLNKIQDGADFVVGSRYIKGGSIPKNWGIDRKIFSILGNLVIRFGFMKLSITEWTNGYRAIKTWLVKEHIDTLRGYTGYVFQVAFLDNAIKSGAVVKEIPVNFIDRVEGSSKIDSFEYIYQTLKYVFFHSTFIKFAIVGGVGFIIDFGISFLLIEIITTAVWLSTIISAETAIVSNFILNNKWSFKHKKISRKSGRKSFIWSFLKFNIIASGSIIIQTTAMTVTTNIFGLTYWYIYKVLIITLVIIPYSYFFYNKLVWKENG
ncbi:dolichyl-phosphate beta-D-mannosyltransferase [Candidatus Roizmanbacteria bacterium CG11_big_fil_rev_8_21_14_0_20_36_8]|uniref:Dolichyl-phosphate beta-D-mannosyltransferase n=2 Tax=Candidatus Roizmaniibacteriota TaxID=1752723 RepID=A0A2M6ITV3_9BACT|nr:MAG: dolichyl-phosphate beta-D-mannosyltransferase [Candidatus Roizmanbacteria bacterium CG11_big_fil_rev_8_21_14_0_20_36_8]PIZ65051.1 MAG: glycosyltransferase family 2 protein [Candidatus Roizmanbacteria bacterium CG_4_10_14_0_2_um_filter_36_9]